MTYTTYLFRKYIGNKTEHKTANEIVRQRKRKKVMATEKGNK